jgi:type I restriction enzyme S subunit
VRIQNLKDKAAPFNYYDGPFEPKHRVKTGAVLISWAGQLVSFGVHIWDGPEGLLNQHIFRVDPYVEVDPHFLRHALSQVVERSKSRFHGSEMKHLTKGTLENATIPLPPLAIQREFGRRARRAERLQARQAGSSARMATLVQSLYHSAFNGQL